MITARWLLLGTLALGCSGKVAVESNTGGGGSGAASGSPSLAGQAGHTNADGGGSSGNGGNFASGGSSAGAGGASLAGNDNAGTAGTLTTTGGGGSSAGSGGAPSGGAPAGGAPSGGMGGAASDPIIQVTKSAGCGMAPPATFTAGVTSASQIIHTAGTKPQTCADSVCGAWTYDREYFVTLPAGYDSTKPYPLVFEGPGCGGGGKDVYPLTDPVTNAANVGNTVIRVGLTPPPNAIGHATNPNQLCFDDKEGDDSVDFVFYENLYDKLTSSLCVDRNRVFASGNSSGAWLANELGCKYAGDATRPVRGVLVNGGGLPTDPKFEPTCTPKPMAGFWVGQTQEPSDPFVNDSFAINRAISVNGCTGGNWPDTEVEPYPIGGGNPDPLCKQVVGCPTNYPVVVCLIAGSSHTSNDNAVNPGFSTFLRAFEHAPLLTP